MKDADQTLARNQIMNLFRKCGLFPLDRQVEAAFRTVFKGRLLLINIYSIAGNRVQLKQTWLLGLFQIVFVAFRVV